MSAKGVIHDVLALLDRGYVPYTGEVGGQVYCRLRCPRPERGTWFTSRGRFVCLGCARRCAQSDGVGFQVQLPGVRRGFQVAFAHLPQVTAEELLAAKTLLRVDEAAFVLGVSPQQVYSLIDAGKLDRHLDLPVRVTAESVREEMGRLAE